MSIKVAVPISCWIQGDNTTTSFDLDLATDPYFVIGSGASNVANANDSKPVNWPPVDGFSNLSSVILLPSGSGSVSVSGHKLTITFATAPALGAVPVEVSMFLQFTP
jgi:hypothetical protein